MTWTLGLLALAGCTQSTPSPTVPAQSPALSPDTLFVQPHISAITEAGIFADAPFAAVDITIDPVTLKAEILPVRIAQAPPPTGQKFVVDLTGVMTGDLGCPDCLSINGLRFDVDGQLLVDLALTHPIAAPNLSQQIGTAALHVNNVRGFVVNRIEGPDGFIGTSDDPTLYTPTGLNADPLGLEPEDIHNVIYGLLTNADGYSRDITPLIAPGFDTVYPYVVFGADDGSVGTGSFGTDGWIGPELENPSGYNVFAQGSTINGSLKLDLANQNLGTQQVTFRFVLTSSYVVSRKYFGGQQGSKLDPLYFMPEGALMSAWRVTSDFQGVDGLGTPPREGTNDVTQIEFYIRDWQKAVGTNIVPALEEDTDVNGVLGASRPKTVAVDIPGITPNVLQYDITNSLAAGTEADPVIVAANIPNNPAAPPGEHVGFVAVYDERTNGPIIGAGETFDLYETGGADRDLVPYNLNSSARSYVTYQLFTYTVGDTPAHAIIDYMTAREDARLVVDARSSYVDLPATGITTYEYVYDYTGDPLEFNTPDATVATPILTTLHTMSPGAHTIGLRITSNLGDTDITSAVVTVAATRDPFSAPDATGTVLTGISGLRLGVQAQDFNDLSQTNPMGADNLLVLGNRLYLVFYGNPGLPQAGLHVLRSLDGGTTWTPATELISAANPNFTQYGGATITGAISGGQDRVLVALGTISYLTTGTGRILVFENTNASVSTTWSQTMPESYALNATRTAACAPALAMNPANPGEVHLLYGTDTGSTVSGVNRRWRVRSSTTGAAGLSAAFQTIDGTAGDSGWMTDTGTSWCNDLAVHPLTGRTFMLLGTNRWSYMLRTDDQGASWLRPLASFDHGATFYRDGDLLMDPWLADTYYVVRNRRGSQFADPFLPILRGSAGVLINGAPGTPLGARSAADMGFPSFDTSNGHVQGAMHETGELELCWTEALGPGGGPGTYQAGPHVQLDMLRPSMSPSFVYDPDLTVNGTTTGANPSVEVAQDGRVHVIWGDAVLGRIYYRRG